MTAIIHPSEMPVEPMIFNEEGMVPLDRRLAKDIQRTLFAHFPGYMWGIEIPPANDVVIIRNLDCDPTGSWGMMKRKSKLSPSMWEIVMAGGEFLERAGLFRGARKSHETDGRNRLSNLDKS